MSAVTPTPLVELITAADPEVRNRALAEICAGLSTPDILAQCEELERFRRESTNLYERVRALFFLYAIHRFILPARLAGESWRAGHIPPDAFEHLLGRRFEEAARAFLAVEEEARTNDTLASGLARSYHALGLQSLADQVRSSVRSVRGNQWMFRTGHPLDHPLRVHRALVERTEGTPFPLLRETCAVRMDLSHSSWSDIFFLGMDYPECARVLNISVDLALHGEGKAPSPPVEAYFRILDEPVIRLVSIDLGARAEVSELPAVFDFARDYLGLLKAAVIAAGVVPPGLEGSGGNLSDVLARVFGPGRGFELVSSVNNIPKGSRLAVSTNLLGALIAALMRATGQTASLEGPLLERERRLVAARAILGEWLGGSGGGWQDSGGVWPGIKVIEGARATEDDPEYGISRGRLLPQHTLLGEDVVSPEVRRKLQESLILVHGGMAQNVGPILEMVTEKYLLREAREWAARQRSVAMFDEIVGALKSGDIRRLGSLLSEHFEGPLQAIIPWANNRFTETIIERIRAALGEDYWGFWMLGGMSGGGMGFIVAPQRQAEAKGLILGILRQAKRELEHALPFAMDPVVYDFALNENGCTATLCDGSGALLPPAYYRLVAPALLRMDPRTLPAGRLEEMRLYSEACERDEAYRAGSQKLLRDLLPTAGERDDSGSPARSLNDLLAENGFDALAHESIRDDLRAGRIGLYQNRLPRSTRVEDVREDDVTALVDDAAWVQAGGAALSAGELGVLTLAAGAGSRWTGGAGVVKGLHPYARFEGQYRSFVETHLAKSRHTGQRYGAFPAHVFSTSYLTHEPIAQFLALQENFAYEGPLHLSRGRSIGLRLVPMERDLRYAWEETAQQVLDEQQQKMRESARAALIGWARTMGEGSDYRDNLPLQCLHPVGHWYEVPNLLLNGTLHALLQERPQLKVLLLHNIDTLGANLDAAALGAHLCEGATLTFEVITRRVEDHGGGLARINGQVRLVEGMALPSEDDEFKLRYYNSASTWISIDPLLALFGLSRDDLVDTAKVASAVRAFAGRLPTYITLKDVKKRWGRGQEDIYPVTQFEKLWGDMSALPEVESRFLRVPRARGQQLKDQAQLDGWLRDGAHAHIASLCAWR